MSTTGDPLDLASQKLAELEQKRAELEGAEDSDEAVRLLGEITELAKEAHARIEQARREADAQP